MDKELKIVVTLFLLYFIYGLGSLFNSGGFIVPVYLTQIVLLSVAVLFYFMNLKAKGAWLLLVYVFVQLLASLVDGYTVGFISYRINSKVLVTLSESATFSVVFIIIYFSFFAFLNIHIHSKMKSLAFFLISNVLLGTTVVLFFFPEMSLFRDICFFLYLLFVIVMSNRKLKGQNQVISVLTYQFFLLFTLEGMEYFH